MNNKLAATAVIIGGALAFGARSEAGLLDRLKSKAEEAKAATQELRDEVDTTVDVEARAEAEVDRALPPPVDVERSAAVRAEGSEAGQAARQLEYEANAVATADERAKAAVTGEVRATEREVQAATDVEGRSRGELSRTDAAAALRAGQAEADSLQTADERAQMQIELELQRRRDEIDRDVDD